MLTWSKPLRVALGVQPINTIGLILSVVLFVGTSWKKTRPFFESIPGFSYDVNPFGSAPKAAIVEKGSEETLEIPAAWLKGRKDIVEVPDPKARKKGNKKRHVKASRSGQKTVRLISKAPGKKFKVPGLLRFKQLCAVVLLLINVFLSQGTLLSGPESRVMFWFFVFQAWICLEFLWKTRRRKVQEIET